MRSPRRENWKGFSYACSSCKSVAPGGNEGRKGGPGGGEGG